jgi:hypothetical protein
MSEVYKVVVAGADMAAEVTRELVHACIDFTYRFTVIHEFVVDAGNREILDDIIEQVECDAELEEQ